MTESERQDKNPMQRKHERFYLDICRNHPDQVIMDHELSVRQGFEYFASPDYRDHAENSDSLMKRRLKAMGSNGKASMAKVMVRYGPKMMKGLKRCFSDLEPYYPEIKASTFKKAIQMNTTHNAELWQELNEYSSNKWDIIKIGFTKLPPQLIFKDKCVLFPYALVFMQEMKKDKIDYAPQFTAGIEVMRVYATLGEAVNDIARWLRKKGVRCQSNHPLGGIVCTPPLAGKAGMGGIGRHGLLITPEFGPRQRLAPIFIEEKLFDYTDNTDHFWIEDHCISCGLCQKNCPTSAIQNEKKINIDNLPGIGSMRTCIDRDKCFPYFTETLGCSICIKVCPFSNGEQTYEKLKSATLKKKI